MIEAQRGVCRTEYQYLACPRCGETVSWKGYGLVSCDHCNSVMLRETAVVKTAVVV